VVNRRHPPAAVFKTTPTRVNIAGHCATTNFTYIHFTHLCNTCLRCSYHLPITSRGRQTNNFRSNITNTFVVIFSSFASSGRPFVSIFSYTAVYTVFHEKSYMHPTELVRTHAGLKQ